MLRPVRYDKMFLFLYDSEHVQYYLVSQQGARHELIEKLYDSVKNPLIELCNVKTKVCLDVSNRENIKPELFQE